MVTVGIRELKQHASELVRKVRENGISVQITYHGEIVAMLIPVPPNANVEEENKAWVMLDELAAQIGQHWPQEKTSPGANTEGSS